MANTTVGVLRVLLEANAQKLESEFAKATITIKDFDKFTENAGRKLQAMVGDFSGQKIVAEAARMAAAVEKIGGVSVLTERELKRVQSVVEQATDKLRRMGTEVPPSIAKLSTELTTLGASAQKSSAMLTTVGAEASKAGGFFGSLGAAGKALGPLLPVTSVIGLTTSLVAMGKSAVESAGNLADLSDKTGLSTDALQRMQHVANQTGSSVDTFAAAAFKLGVTISQGTTKARDAVAELGLEYDNLRKQKPEDQFAAVIKALEGVESVQERNRLGVALFGKQFAEIAASVEQGYTKIADAASLVDEAQIKALDEAADAWTKFVDDAQKEIQRLLGSIILAAQDIDKLKPPAWMTGDLAKPDRMGSLLVLSPAEQRMQDEWIAQGKAIEDFAAHLMTLRKAYNDIKLEAKDAGEATRRDFVAEIEAAKDKLKELKPDQIKQLNAAIIAGSDDAKEYAESIGLNELALKLYQQQARDAASETKKIGQEAKKAAEEQKRFNDRLREFGQITTPLHKALQEGWFGKIETELKDNVTLVGAFTGEMGKASKELDEWAFKHGAVVPVVRATGVEIEKATKKTADWSKQLSTLTQAFAQLAQIAGESGLGRVFQAIGNLVGAMNLAHTAGENIAKGLKEIDEAGGGAAEKFGLIAANSAAYVSAMAQVVQSTNAAEAALGTFSSTASFLSGLGMGGASSVGIGLVGAGIAYGIAVDRARDEQRRIRAAMEAEIANINKQIQELLEGTEDIGEAFRKLGLDINKAFAPDTETRLANMRQFLADLRKELQDVNADFAPLLASAEQLGRRLPQSILDSLTELEKLGILSDANVAALDRLRNAGEFDIDKVEAAAQRLGIRFSELGPKLRGARVTETAKDIVNDLQLIIDAGGDVGGALFEARKTFSDLVNEAKRTGTALPENMKDWIEELLRAGHLVDENGNKLESLEGLNFGPKIKTQWEIATEALEKQLEVLERIAQAIERMPVPNYGQPPAAPGAPPPTGPPPGGTPPDGDGHDRYTGTYGATGRWFEDFGSGTPIVGHGVESVVPLKDAERFAHAVLAGNLGQFVRVDYAVPQPPAMALPPAWTTPGLPIGPLVEEKRGRDDFLDHIRDLPNRDDWRTMFERLDRTLAISVRDAVRGAV